MPRNIAQLTGVVVTAIIVFGTDLDVVYAMPLGILAGALATYFVSLADGRAETSRWGRSAAGRSRAV